MDLYKRDKIIQLIQNKLKDEQKFQMDNLKEVASDVRENEFLGVIRDDYKKHFDFILMQKKKQKQQLEELLEYLFKSAEQAEITQSLLLQTKGEKQRLLSEIEKIRNEIDMLIIENNKLIGT